jgi:hypothetical protein
MFGCCRKFNQPIEIPDTVTDCREMFYICDSLDQDIIVPDSVTSSKKMFYECDALKNKPAMKTTSLF